MSRPSFERRRRAFTLIELIVTLGLIGLLSALLLPAVQAARESSRRAQCQSNLKQIGLAMANYVAFEGYFPAGVQLSVDPRYLYYSSLLCSGPIDRGFTMPILPYLEQGMLYDTFNYQVAIIGPEQRTARAFLVSTYTCPSDSEAHRIHEFDMKQLFRDSSTDVDVDTNARVYPSSYAGCHSSHGGSALESIFSECKRDAIGIKTSNGCITAGVDVTIATVTDGLSNTMTIVDKSLTTRMRNQPEPVNYSWFVGTYRTNQFIATYGPNVSKYDKRHSTWSESAMSEHPGGVNVLMGDGSVRFVKDSVDATNAVGKPYGIWQRLASRNDGTPIEAGSY
jgi:prepilin-type N-terminal cleavage/methylation domain-containing protein/prepilin-type processing-associated H-X9-DG protein